ncbi:MAG: exo-alpha-sialidase [bacterium]|nr:exo-alpha-sialidase [bacterium]
MNTQTTPRALLLAVTIGTLAIAVTDTSAAQTDPSPIVEVERQLYVEHTETGKSRWVNAYYTGSGLEREEIHTFMAKSDTPENPKRRRSPDNGRTWSGFEEMSAVVSHEQGARIYWGAGPMHYDDETGVTVSIWLRQTKLKLYHNHSFSRVSSDGGRTWSEPNQLRYEDGASFDPANPLNPDYLDHNQSYFGSNIIRHSNGSLIHAGAAVNVPYVNETGKSYDGRVPADAKSIGSVCYIGQWNAKAKDYDWVGGNPVWVPLEVSSRGLMEPEVTELADGRVLVVWRGSNTPTTPGRKWFSLSEDGGRTLSPVKEWTYTDGTRFYSPSSLHRFLRHSVTGKLYWLGNICDTPPNGNGPRYPLIIAEVDESSALLKYDTVTIIDKKSPSDSDALQLSNFYILEDRETHRVEVYVSRLGEDPDDFWGANAYRYVLTFP